MDRRPARRPDGARWSARALRHTADMGTRFWTSTAATWRLALARATVLGLLAFFAALSFVDVWIAAVVSVVAASLHLIDVAQSSRRSGVTDRGSGDST